MKTKMIDIHVQEQDLIDILSFTTQITMCIEQIENWGKIKKSTNLDIAIVIFAIFVLLTMSSD